MMREHELRLVWQFQQFEPTRLRTTDGRRVVVEHAGIPNTDGGPDFLDAHVRIGETWYVGDVEVHLRSAGWVAHHHHLDSHYNRVVLHVVLQDDGTIARTVSRRTIPVLVLHAFLDTRLPVPAPVRLSSLQQLSPSGIEALLRDLAIARLERKVLRLEGRLREITDEQCSVLAEPRGRYDAAAHEIPFPTREYCSHELTSVEAWEQLVYEGVMEALGYSKNRVPCARLASTVRLRMLGALGLANTPSTMALLFGAAGLLPPHRRLPDSETRRYVRGLRKRWTELRPFVRSLLLHEADWLFFRLRPANFPTARLASVSFLLPGLFAAHDLHALLVSPTGSPGSRGSWIRSVQAMFSFHPDEFWAGHFSFTHPRGPRGIALGQERILDVAVNILVPATLLLARSVRQEDLFPWGVALLESLPPGQTNATLRQLATVDGVRFVPGNALIHQGAMELGERLRARSMRARIY